MQNCNRCRRKPAIKSGNDNQLGASTGKWLSSIIIRMGAAVRTFGGICILGGLFPIQAHCDEPYRSKDDFDANWLFTKNDPSGFEKQLSYPIARPWMLPTGAGFLSAEEAKPSRPQGTFGTDVPYCQEVFDDSAWRHIDLPHDWGVEGSFHRDYPGSTGKLEWWGVGWYRKHFTIPEADRAKKVYVTFDGAMSYANVWLNGQYVGGWPYGYTTFQLDLTPYIRFGRPNVIAVRLDNPPDSSRWYPGGGIYRNVWLEEYGPVHIPQSGVFVTTPLVREGRAEVSVQTTIQNDSGNAVMAEVSSRLFELNSQGSTVGDPIASSTPEEVTRVVAVGRAAVVSQMISVPNPKLWSPENPCRYLAVTEISVAGKTVDEYKTEFGIRSIEFSANEGFLLNGRRLKLNGVCLHHDLGALGSAVNTRAIERRLEELREMGCNAIRTSHNPPAPELLDLCDKMGFMVMDEAFDCWNIAKCPNDYHLLFPDWHEQDLRAMVQRDRNHPCVVLWSTGNEIPEQGVPEGWRLAEYLSGIVRSEDRTRPVTMACNDVKSGFNGFQMALDVLGYNYHPTAYEKFHAKQSLIPVFGSETASTVSSRGSYTFPPSGDMFSDLSGLQVSSYDLCAPPWATRPDDEFRAQDELPYVAGEFVWTGFDYLGEPTPYGDDAWTLFNRSSSPNRAKVAKKAGWLGEIPISSRSSYFGIVDLCGFKKDRFYLYQARWRPSFPMAHILPHWNWPNRLGQVTPVFVYTSGDEAELFLNGESLGRKAVKPYTYRLRWDDVKYAPGEVRVVAYKNGKKWAEDSVATTSQAARLALSVERSSVVLNGKDLAFVTVSIEDALSRVVPTANNHIRFSIRGPGEIVAVDNGDPTCSEPFHTNEHDAFDGLAQVIVRGVPGGAGPILLTATSTGLASATIMIPPGR